MGAIDPKMYAELESDFNKILMKGEWKPEDYCKMKDIQKLLYYIDVRQAMKEGEGYPGSEYMENGEGMSFARGRSMPNRSSVTGRFMSGDGGRSEGRGGSSYERGGSGAYDRGSGIYYPQGMEGNMYYDGRGGSGRRYYDSEKEKAIHKLHHMMENTDDSERKSALNFAIHAIQDNQ